VHIAAWLRAFIEGLGLSDVVLIAGDGTSSAALELASTDDFLIRKLILMGDAGDSVRTASSERMLFVQRGDSAADQLRQIEDFIA